MRRRRRNTESKELMEADLTPMIDVTFQLIAFFMFIINFAEVDRAEEILLPSSQLAKPPSTPPDFQILMNLEQNGKVKFEGQLIEKIDFMTPIFNQEISSARREGVAVGDISVVIRAHEDTPTGLVQELISKCQDSELQSFSLRVKESPN